MGGKIVWAVCLLQLLATPAAAARGLDVSTKGDSDNKAKGGVDEASLGDEKPKFFWCVDERAAPAPRCPRLTPPYPQRGAHSDG